jgi:hypothetical protein
MDFFAKHSLVKSMRAYFVCTVKPVYNDHPWDRKKVVVVQRWSLFRGSICHKKISEQENVGVVWKLWKQKLICKTEKPNFD